MCVFFYAYKSENTVLRRRLTDFESELMVASRKG